MTFRDRLLASLRAMRPVVDVPGILVGGSQVPNLLEAEAASTLVVSQNVDLVVPVGAHGEVKDALRNVRGHAPSSEEPSVWLPDADDRLEVSFIGTDASLRSADETYALEDEQLPLLVFGLLSYLRPAPILEVEDLRIPVPRPAGLLLEKLLTERSGLEGQRDLLVALGLILVAKPIDLDELASTFSELGTEERLAVLSSLRLLSLMEPLPDMPDPTAGRERVAQLAALLEAA